MVLGADAVRLEPGWVAPAYGVRLPAPLVSAVAGPAPAARFLTLIAPLEPGAPAPRLEREGETVLVDGHPTLVLSDDEVRRC